MNESETIHECNTWKESTLYKTYNEMNNTYNRRLQYIIISNDTRLSA